MIEKKKALIETRELSMHFKNSKGMLHAVDKVSLNIEEGTTLGVVGESGCGKSTLGRVILKLLEPTSGEILLDGIHIENYTPKQTRILRRDAQMIFQDPYSSIDPRMSVSDIIAEFMLINKTYSSRTMIYEKVVELMDTVGLAKRLADAYPHELDGGRRQRIGIARALSLNPRFIVCDEPVSALDVSIQAQILNLLMELQDKMGLTYMFITHDMSVVKHISNEIAVMYLGQCVEIAPSEELFRNPMHPYTKALLSAIPVPDLSMRQKRFETIRGEVTSPINPLPGCRFCARCKHAQESCKGEDPVLKEYGAGHFVACHRIKDGDLL